MKVAVYGDLHITEKSIPEIKEIFEEIYFNKDFDRVIFLGDCFNRKSPTSKEIDFFTWLITEMLKKGEVDIVVGNHEESAKTTNALQYLQHIGVTLHQGESLVMLGKFKLGIGHCFFDQGEEFCRDGRFKVEELSKKYDLTLFGHFHKFHKYCDNVYHLGSIRRISFNELEAGVPKYAILTPESGSVDFCDVQTAIPMAEVDSVSKALKMPPRTKLRLVFKSFEKYLKNVNKLPELKKKFHTFKIKHDYTQKVEKKKVVKKGKSFSDIFNKFLKETVKNKEVKNLIQESLDE